MDEQDNNKAPETQEIGEDASPAIEPDNVKAEQETPQATQVIETTGDEPPDEDFDPMATLIEKQQEAEKKKENAAKEKGKKGKKEKPPEDEFTRIIKQGKLKAEKKKQLKKKIKLGVLAGVVVFGVVGWMYLMTPWKGGMDYAICRTFAERTLTFPSTFEVRYVEYPPNNSIRVWYMMTDSFGNSRMQPIQCYFKPDDGSGYYQLEKVRIRRRDVDQETVDAFNMTIPAIYAYPPDLALPYLDTETLKNLYFEVNRFRKPIL